MDNNVDVDANACYAPLIMKIKYVRMTVWLEEKQARRLKKKKRMASGLIRKALEEANY